MEQNNNNKYRSFKEARAFVHTLGIKSIKEWEEYCKSGDKPDDIPSRPDVVYGNPVCYRNFRTGESLTYKYLCKTYPDFEKNYLDGYCDVPIITEAGEIFEPVDWKTDDDEIYGNPKSSHLDKTDLKMGINAVETNYPFVYRNFRTGETFSFEHLCETNPNLERNYDDEYGGVPIITEAGEILERVDWLIEEDEI